MAYFCSGLNVFRIYCYITSSKTSKAHAYVIDNFALSLDMFHMYTVRGILYLYSACILISMVGKWNDRYLIQLLPH